MPRPKQGADTYIVAHVPVDEFSIVEGPDAEACAELFAALCDAVIESNEESVTVSFGLRTGASHITFYRKVRMMHISDYRKGLSFSFKGVFGERPVFGTYNMQTREGSFLPATPSR